MQPVILFTGDAPEDDGKTTSNYFGGEGKPDGPGHGHVEVNEQGDVTYARESSEHGGGEGTEGS